jgi:hypothetical protein
VGAVSAMGVIVTTHQKSLIAVYIDASSGGSQMDDVAVVPWPWILAVPTFQVSEEGVVDSPLMTLVDLRCGQTVGLLKRDQATKHSF